MNLNLSADDWKVKGNDATATHDFQKAIECYSKAIDQDPTNHVYFSNRSAAYLSKHDATKALADAEKCIHLNPSWAKGYGRKGAALHELGDFDNSIKMYKHGLSIDPDSAHLNKSLVAVETSAKKYRCPSPESMYDAVCSGDLAGINALLRMGYGVNEPLKGRDNREFTALGWAFVHVQQEAIELLLNAGADGDNVGIGHMRPLVPSIVMGVAGLVKLLIDAGASVHALVEKDQHMDLRRLVPPGTRGQLASVLVTLTEANRASPIALAVVTGRADIVELLIQAGASAQGLIDRDGRTLLHHAARYGFVEVARVLLAAGARIDALTTEGRMLPISVAMSYGQPEMVKLLIKAGASANARMRGDQTLLHLAAADGNAVMVRELLAGGARIDDRLGEDRAPAVTIATLQGHAGVVQLLINAGASPHEWVDKRRWTLLHFAAERGFVEVARVLLAAGAHTDALDVDSMTPLFLAVNSNKDKVVDLLVKAGATVDATDKDGCTPLLAYLLRGMSTPQLVVNRKLVQLLIKAGADVNVVHGTLCVSILHTAAVLACPGIVQDLLEAGADIDARDIAGLNAMYYLNERDKVLANVSTLQSSGVRQRLAATRAVLTSWKAKQDVGGVKTTAAGSSGAGAGAGAPACSHVRKEVGKKKKKKKKKVVKDENRVCDGPDCSSLGVNRCKACKRPAYCCVECQRAHWNAGHKQDCQIWRDK